MLYAQSASTVSYIRVKIGIVSSTFTCLSVSVCINTLNQLILTRHPYTFVVSVKIDMHVSDNLG